MKPLKTASFFLSILFVIIGFSYFNQKATIEIGSIQIQLPTQKHLFSEQTSGEMPSFHDQQAANMAPKEELSLTPTVAHDTLPDAKDSIAVETTATDTMQVAKDMLLDAQVVPLLYHIDSNRPHPLANLYRGLRNTGYAQVRIMHYGDSQIEGDRITSYLRNHLQETFGGSGIGLLPMNLIPGTHTSLKHEPKGDWERYTLYDIRKKHINHTRLGVLFSYCKFGAYSHTEFPATLTLSPSPIAFNRIANYNQVRLFYGENSSPLVIQLACNDTLFDADLLSPRKAFKELKWQLPTPPEELEFRFIAETSPEFYGISLESSTGVIVDNIPLRGSSGTDFTRVDRSLQKAFYAILEPDVILLQFGVNLVPHLTANFEYYEGLLRRQLQRLKEVAPNSAIVLLGVSDMAHKKEGFYQSYENIEPIRAIQKKVALELGAIFWDTYEAMGGKNAMVKWVGHQPPLGRKDYTHFSYKGATFMAELFYESLMNDYEKYSHAHAK